MKKISKECANSDLLQTLPVGASGRKRKTPPAATNRAPRTPVSGSENVATPGKTPSGTSNEKRRPFQDITNKTPSITPNDKIDAKNLVEEYDRTHETPLCEVLPTLKGSGVMKKPTKVERQKYRRDMTRKLKFESEEKQQKDNKDMYAVVALCKSFNAHDKERALIYMESKEAATERAKTGKKRRVKVPDNFDKDGLLKFVNELPDNSTLPPLTKLAHLFGVSDKNNIGNKIVKQFLIDSGIDFERFNNVWVERYRRCYNKNVYGISEVMPRSAKELKKALKEEIENGNLSLGELIAPKTFTKIFIDKETNEIRKESFAICGRKIPLRSIREKLNEDHTKLGILRPLPNIKRHLAVWADHSSILDHGYLLLTIKPIFSSSIYFTDEEMNKKRGGSWNVQEIVEKPTVYIFGRSEDSILEKLTYVETRAEDIKDLSSPTEINGQVIHDTLRFFQGDHPELQYESGNKQGGHYPCLCCTRIDNFSNLSVILRSEIQDPKTRITFLRKGPNGRSGKAKPYDNLKCEEVLEELRQRDPPFWQECKNAAEREKFLKETLRGIVRPPALLHGDFLTLEDIPEYEVSSVEPLHDLKGHIANVWMILPEFLEGDEVEKFNNVYSLIFKQGKDHAKGSDYRISAIIMYAELKDIARQCIKMLLYTLMLATKLAYLPAEKRSPKIVLLTYNVTFVHAVYVITVFGRTPSSSKITKEKLYGIYSHSIFAHFPSVQRIIPLSSIHCESEERTFTSLNRISKTTSNRHLEDVRDNGIIRIQCQMKVKMEDPERMTLSGWQSQISRWDKTMGPIENTIIWPSMCDERDYQAHLERISDFLLTGEGVWWHLETDTGNFIFHDGDGEPDFRAEGPQLQDFYEDSLTSTYAYLKKCWQECLDKKVVLPIGSVHTYDENGHFLERSNFTHVLDPLPPDEEEEVIEDVELDVVPVVTENKWDGNSLFPPMKKTVYRQAKDNLYSEFADDKNIITDYGKAALKVLGPSPLLLEFDEKCRMRRTLPEDKKIQRAYNNKKCLVAKKLQDVQIKASKWLKDWGNEHFVATIQEPNIDDIRADERASIVYEKKDLAETILKKWGVKFN